MTDAVLCIGFCHISDIPLFARPCLYVMWFRSLFSVLFFSMHKSHVNLNAGHPSIHVPGAGVFCIVLMLWAFPMCNDFGPIFGKTLSQLSQGCVFNFFCISLLMGLLSSLGSIFISFSSSRLSKTITLKSTISVGLTHFE